MIINEKKKEYIDKEIFKMVELLVKIEEKEVKKNKDDFKKGSFAHKSYIDLTDRLIDSPIIKKTLSIDHKFIIAIEESFHNETIGYTEKEYPVFDKFINNIYKEETIRTKISIEFIHDKVFSWITKTYRTKQAQNLFSSYLLDEIENSIEELKFYYPILHLDIEKPFFVGNVKIEYLTKEFFDKLFENQTKNKDKAYDSAIKKYVGAVFATYIIKAERSKAEEIALNECSLAVDILKICSDTTEAPQLKLSFDIDSRIRENITHEVLITKADITDGNLSVSEYRGPSHHSITLKDLNYMYKNRELITFHNFLLNMPLTPSELEQLIINGMKRYGNAISNVNYHQRIVELFTILESLLLIDNNSPIIESVCKYGSKLVFKKPEHRKDIISLLKDMYNVRSALIHHAKEKPFEIDKLRKLQIFVVLLFSQLIEKSNRHKTKESLLQEIDDAILNAY